MGDVSTTSVFQVEVSMKVWTVKVHSWFVQFMMKSRLFAAGPPFDTVRDQGSRIKSTFNFWQLGQIFWIAVFWMMCGDESRSCLGKDIPRFWEKCRAIVTTRAISSWYVRYFRALAADQARQTILSWPTVISSTSGTRSFLCRDSVGLWIALNLERNLLFINKKSRIRSRTLVCFCVAFNLERNLLFNNKKSRMRKGPRHPGLSTDGSHTLVCFSYTCRAFTSPRDNLIP